MAMVQSPGEPSGLGLKPERHIAGFSIRKEDGTPIPLIFEAAVGKARDTVVLKLDRPDPREGVPLVRLRLDPYCNLTDGLDMAVPVFGPIALDEVPESKLRPSPRLWPRQPLPPVPQLGRRVQVRAWRRARARPFLGAGQAPDHHRRSRSRLEGDHRRR